MDGRVVVYYRAAGEHLNPAPPSGESGSSLNGLLGRDFGHAFLRIDDRQTGDSSYVDGWMLDDGSFTWNSSESQDRLDDHHNVAWETSIDIAQQGLQEILGIMNSSTPYSVLHKNCTNMTAHVLNDLGWPVAPATTYVPTVGDVAMPGDMGNARRLVLDQAGIAYTVDEDLPVALTP